MNPVPKPRKPATALARPSSPPGADALPVVGIGASTGGLEACSHLMKAISGATGMAFILIQHLDPTHDSLIVELLTGRTALTVCEARDGMALAPDHLYVIPPGVSLSVAAGRLHVSAPAERHGARLPFDFLLKSMAEDLGPLCACVILSGNGADGSAGLRAISEAGGLVVAQSPDEAEAGDMPRNAILTGAVDLVLPVHDIPAALAKHFSSKPGRLASSAMVGGMAGIVELLRTQTRHDFALYKPGTLKRRTERRMAMSGLEAGATERYLELLRGDPRELDLLASDLLINVTNFFRDPKTFELLAETVIPQLVAAHAADLPLRIWVAGCSTGEETYSLAMLFREAVAQSQKPIKLQIFASDIDPDAVARAREGVYPETIAADISPGRLTRFFTKEGKTYRIASDLRSLIVFTVQDVLADPPFSRLDFISCRNLLIYLKPEAQARVISLFHFALCEGGLLLLGNSETTGNAAGRFDVVSKPARLYRHTGRARPGDLHFALKDMEFPLLTKTKAADQGRTSPQAMADLCQRMMLDAYAPASVLINRKNDCLYVFGAIDRYLRVAAGYARHDILSMARDGVRTKLRSAIQQARQDKRRCTISGGRLDEGSRTTAFSIDVQPVRGEEDELLLVCFIDQPLPRERETGAPGASAPRVAELENELEATRTELHSAIRNLEISAEEQKAIHEEALSVNEEFQSTNEEILTSKEELQSLNEELTALNSQLQETLERQRTTANDLQNVLYSTDLATVFLDRDLNIRFFTPPFRLLFKVIASDIGRPLADISSLAEDPDLMRDARAVLDSQASVEREIQATAGAWYIRRILPYRIQDGTVEGVVITFTDITERRKAADALEAARQEAQMANVGKSRFLAAASHDLRQPLQSLSLLQGLLAKIVEGDKAVKLVARIDDVLGTISGMLNALLDINQIEAGAVKAERIRFPVNSLFEKLRPEFAYLAQAKGLEFRVVPCSVVVESDPRLLEQMVRNLMANAVKYTRKGRIVMGGRRRPGRLDIEICDSGVGIPETELQNIFNEYHQLDNASRDRSRGLGLGLSIVQRLSVLLGHAVHVRSTDGKGSSFGIEIPLSGRVGQPYFGKSPAVFSTAPLTTRRGTIVVVEDDPEVLELLEHLLLEEGHTVHTATDSKTALDKVSQNRIRPDLILTNYNLPYGMDGLKLAEAMRQALRVPDRPAVPVIILTGDISTATLRDIALRNCVQLSKPVTLPALNATIQELLEATPPQSNATAVLPGSMPSPRLPATVYLVDDDGVLRASLRQILEEYGHRVEDFESCETFLDAYLPSIEACLLIDAYLPGMKGVELLRHLRDIGSAMPSIMITGNSDVSTAVEAMKAGAINFIEKPIGREELLSSVKLALEQSHNAGVRAAWHSEAGAVLSRLTARQREVMDRVLAGEPSKMIAFDLKISQRTVENHRNAIMKKTGSKSLPALARLALAATVDGG
jgi:two-component system CheB/CheR fusion protein